MTLLQRLKNRVFQSAPKAIPPIFTLPGDGSGKTALVSYIKDVFTYEDADPHLNDHTSKWESKEIARIFQRMGYEVDLIDYNDQTFRPSKSYDVIFDIHYNIDRLAAFLPQECVKILHITGSYPGYSIEQELARVRDLERRKKGHYSPKRIVDQVYFTRSMEKANFCTLFGNDFTICTFPEALRYKIHLVTPTAAQLCNTSQMSMGVPNTDTFLWTYGSGAVHKGLDLVLDIFARRPDLNLHVIGAADREDDFCKLYERELFHTPNIHNHGFINGLSRNFSDITAQCFAFIAPSCSESLSVAAATCLTAGLYPILSKQNGITLPENCGIILDETNHATIEAAIERLRAMPVEEIARQASIGQEYATDRFSRATFTKNMTHAINRALSRN